METVHTPFSRSWLSLMNDIQDMPEDYITSEIFYSKCCQNGVETDRERLDELIKWYQDLGVCFYSKAHPISAQYMVLKPRWLLNALYILIFNGRKYAKNGNISAWEMETLCFYYHAHELENVNYYKYGFSNFFDLPEEPEVDRQFTKNGKTVNIFKLHKICGTCIAKNKTKSTVTLLTREGVVEVKFRKEYFSLFDKQISERGADGVKHVVEKSWFNRGSMIVVQGIRSGDNFVAKKYNSSGGHQLYKIDEVFGNGDIRLRSTRYQGDIEEDV
jgi:hypothetical protein